MEGAFVYIPFFIHTHTLLGKHSDTEKALVKTGVWNIRFPQYGGTEESKQSLS